MRGEAFALLGIDYGAALEERYLAQLLLALVVSLAAGQPVSIDHQLAGRALAHVLTKFRRLFGGRPERTRILDESSSGLLLVGVKQNCVDPTVTPSNRTAGYVNNAFLARRIACLYRPPMTPGEKATKSTPAQSRSAFLKLLRFCEFGRLDDQDYFTLYGFSKFTDQSTHPDQVFVVGKHKDGSNITSSPAGAYQIVFSTYSDAERAGVVSDFTPASQDKIALWLITHRGALTDIDAGKIASAIGKLNRVWVSLPGGSHPKVSLARALALFQSYLQPKTEKAR
jgi:muramidase (phage lysozyme)